MPRLVQVWDLPVRLFHWVLVALVVFSFVTGKLGGNWLTWHFRSGYCILALVLFRILWGLFGPTPRPELRSEGDLARTEEVERQQLAQIAGSWTNEEETHVALVQEVDTAGEEMLVRSLDTSEDLIRDSLLHLHLHEVERQIVAISQLSDESELR